MQWESVIGLEIHAQLATRSKIFSGASIAFGAQPNAQACIIDLGFPGVLPVLNAEAVRMAVRFGVAIDATIARRSVFARKSYFYPDLPKGYQISQYELPIVQEGGLTIDLNDSETRRIRIRRAHLEEDAGKSLHQDFEGLSGIDLNRAGTPLLEIVSDPDLRSAREAVAYMRKIRSLVRYLGICDGNMQEGSLRCDVNVSVRLLGDYRLGTRTEVKNLNSFRFVERAINYEVRRQIEVLEEGGTIAQETRSYDSDNDETRPLRGKEDAHDYRYFPDPDLLPLEISEAYIGEVRGELPELPDAKKLRFCREYGLSRYDADVLTASRETADYFESTVAVAPGAAKTCANWIMGELMAALNRNGWEISRSPVTPAMLGAMIRRIEDNTISGRSAKEVFQAMWDGEGEADHIVGSHGLQQLMGGPGVEALVAEIIASNPEQVAQYRAGKGKVLGFLVGQIMKASRGKADPKQVNELLKSRLGDGSTSA